MIVLAGKYVCKTVPRLLRIQPTDRKIKKIFCLGPLKENRDPYKNKRRESAKLINRGIRQYYRRYYRNDRNNSDECVI